MPDVTLTDPLSRIIFFPDATWDVHVLARHPEMDRYRRLAELAIIDPLEIRFSATDPATRLYFGSGPGSTLMVEVVANVVDGYLKTAHLVRRMRGDVEWSRPNP